jgi:hypothetical protein
MSIRASPSVSPIKSQMVRYEDDDDFMPKSLADQFSTKNYYGSAKPSNFAVQRVLDDQDCCIRIVGADPLVDLEELLMEFAQFGEILSHKTIGRSVHVQFQSSRAAKNAILSAKRNGIHIGKDRKLLAVHLIPNMDYRDPNRLGMDSSFTENTPRKARSRKIAPYTVENQKESFGSGFSWFMNWGTSWILRQEMDADHFFCRVFGNGVMDPEEDDEFEDEEEESEDQIVQTGKKKSTISLDHLHAKIHSMCYKSHQRL